jgi:hypothetical protein
MNGPETRDTDLERIEAALADGRASADDPRERELQELALALRADSPEPRPEFARDLDRRVSDGFGKPRRAGLTLPAALRRGWMPALAGAAALVLVAVVALSSLGGGDGEGGKPIAASAPKTVTEVSPFAPFASRTPHPSAQSGAATADTGRRVERSAQITISTSRDKLQNAADGVGTVAESHGGFVLSSHVSTGDQGEPGGSFVLRVPAKELQATLADLSKLGHLRARSESGQDRTGPYRSVQDRLGKDLVERHTLRLRLRHAKGAKADSIRARIAQLNAEIDKLSGRMHGLQRRTLYSTVTVTLEQDRGGAGAGGGGTGAAWHDALHTLEALLNFFVRAMGVLLPLGLVAGLAGLGTRALRRRRREAALL